MFPKSIRFRHRNACAAAISLLVALSVSPESHAQRFDNPQVDGMPMDGCLGFAVDCEQTAADYFCDMNGYPDARDWATENSPSDTKTLKTKEICDTSQWICDKFSFIECAPDTNANRATITTSPSSPTPNDIVSVTISDTWNNSCVPTQLGLPQPTIREDNVIRINLYPDISSGDICNQVITPWSLQGELGTLPEGRYTVEVYKFVDGNEVLFDTDSVLVSSQPIGINGFGTPPETEFVPTTDEEVQEMDEISERIGKEFDANFQNLRQTMNPHDALQAAVNGLQTNPDVMAVRYHHKSLDIYTRLGSSITVPLDAEYRLQKQLGVSLFRSNKTFLQYINAFTHLISVSFAPTSVLAASNNKALIFSPYQREFKEDLCPIKKALEDAGFDVDFVVDIDMCDVPATPIDTNILKYLTKLNEYSVIFIDSHGGDDWIDTGIPWSALKKSQEGKNFKKTPGVGLLWWEQEKSSTAKIRPKYIKSLSTFSNTLVFAYTCHGAEVYKNLPDAFLKKGAAAYIGFDNTVYSDPNVVSDAYDEFIIPFFDELTKIGTSVLEASENLPTHWNHGTKDICDSFNFGCQTIENEPVDLKIYFKPSTTDFVLLPSVFSGEWRFQGKGTYGYCDVDHPGQRNYQFVTDWHITLEQKGDNLQGTHTTSGEIIGVCKRQKDIEESVTGTVLEDDSVKLTFTVREDAPGCQVTGTDGCSVWIGDASKGEAFTQTFAITSDGNLSPKELWCVVHDPNQGCLIELDSYKRR